MKFLRYLDQCGEWPEHGRHVMAQFDATSIYVYQAYRCAVAQYAVQHQHFGGEWSFNRMSWIKPNFLWMMYRCGWATKEGQERVLAVRLKRSFFDELLTLAVPSTFDPSQFATEKLWRDAVAGSEVRLQWDPDHDPSGRPTARRAVQLGLRGATLRRYATDELISIEDITPFVADQRECLADGYSRLQMPAERIYRSGDSQ